MDDFDITWEELFEKQEDGNWLYKPKTPYVPPFRNKLARKLTDWMGRIPGIGRLVQTFWYCIIDEGIYTTVVPRYGAITFSFLNDGCKPSLWHTYIQVFHHDSKYAGIYCPDGAPRSKAEADARILYYELRQYERDLIEQFEPEDKWKT